MLGPTREYISDLCDHLEKTLRPHGAPYVPWTVQYKLVKGDKPVHLKAFISDDGGTLSVVLQQRHGTWESTKKNFPLPITDYSVYNWVFSQVFQGSPKLPEPGGVRGQYGMGNL